MARDSLLASMPMALIPSPPWPHAWPRSVARAALRDARAAPSLASCQACSSPPAVRPGSCYLRLGCAMLLVQLLPVVEQLILAVVVHQLEKGQDIGAQVTHGEGPCSDGPHAALLISAAMSNRCCAHASVSPGVGCTP